MTTLCSLLRGMPISYVSFLSYEYLPMFLACRSVRTVLSLANRPYFDAPVHTSMPLSGPKLTKQIVPGSSNNLAIDLLVSHVKRQLDSRSLRFRKLLANMENDDNEHQDHQAGSAGASASARRKRLSGGEGENVYLLQQTNQLKVRTIFCPSALAARNARAR